MPTGQRLPQELYACIIDELHDQPEALETCSLVSKSWAARSQKHLFSTVKFSGDNVAWWRNTFPDPTNSLARHARTLIIDNPKESPEDLSLFCNVTYLFLDVRSTEASSVSFARVHGFTPFLKSLEMRVCSLRPCDILNLAHSFPLLENLSITGLSITPEAEPTPSKPLRVSGSFRLSMLQGPMATMVNHLLSLPGGIHFRELDLVCFHGSVGSSFAMALISACAPTLENLYLRAWCACLGLLLYAVVAHFVSRYENTVSDRLVLCNKPPIHLVRVPEAVPQPRLDRFRG